MSSLNKKLKIGIVCYPTHGGSGVVAVELAHSLDKRGHEVHVISYNRPARLDTLSSNVNFFQVDVPDYPLFEYPPYSLALAAQLANIIKNNDLDILHVHYAIPHAVSAWLARKIAGKDDLAIVTTLHGTDITIVGKDPSYKPITRFSIEVSDKVTVVSKWLGQQIHEKINCDCLEDVVYNSVDHLKYNPEHNHKAPSRLCHETPILMHTSNFRPVKRVMDVIDVYLKVSQSRRVQLVMIGDGPDRVQAEQKIRNSPFAKDAHFLGIKDNTEDILPCADAFIFPSNAESFGLAALEAMSCGVPVIGANVGGLPEVVIHQKTGFLTDPGDTDKMADRTLEIINNDNLANELSTNARKRAVEVFNRDNILDRYEDIYQEAIDTVIQHGPKDFSYTNY